VKNFLKSLAKTVGISMPPTRGYPSSILDDLSMNQSLLTVYQSQANSPILRDIPSISYTWLSPDEFYTDDGKLIFVEEEQRVVVWGMNPMDGTLHSANCWYEKVDGEIINRYEWWPVEMNPSELVVSLAIINLEPLTL
jgi:hypothetical protein